MQMFLYTYIDIYTHIYIYVYASCMHANMLYSLCAVLRKQLGIEDINAKHIWNLLLASSLCVRYSFVCQLKKQIIRQSQIPMHMCIYMDARLRCLTYIKKKKKFDMNTIHMCVCIYNLFALSLENKQYLQ